MDEITKKKVFFEYELIYDNILGNLYPAKKSTGFPERNLSVNFSKAYETIALKNNENACSWFEFQFGSSNNLHVDAVIYNISLQELLIIESKRYSNPASKMREVGEDILRIGSFITEINEENKEGIVRIDMRKITSVYGIILADIWNETQLKKDICHSYLEGMANPDSDGAFLQKYKEKIGIDRIPYDLNYYVSRTVIRNYNLLSFMWKL